MTVILPLAYVLEWTGPTRIASKPHETKTADVPSITSDTSGQLLLTANATLPRGNRRDRWKLSALLQSTLNPCWSQIDAMADGRRPFVRWMYGSKGCFRNYSIIGNHYVKFPPEPFSCRSLWNLTPSVKNKNFWTCSATAKEFAKKLRQTFLHFLVQEANLSAQRGSGGLEIDTQGAGNMCPPTKHWFWRLRCWNVLKLDFPRFQPRHLQGLNF